MLSQNKKSKFDYFLSNHLECGVELKGLEVKSIMSNGINLKESYVKIINNEVFLIGANINIIHHRAYDTVTSDDNIRPKKLLLHRSEIKKFQKLLDSGGTTLICTKIYSNDKGIIKAEIALGKGKKLHDKRNTIKERDLERSKC